MTTLKNNFLISTLAVATYVFFYGMYIALNYSSEPLLDLHAFRQTQTAITSFWFIKDGFKLAYETPVGGEPWSIPFEFPLYQYLTALISSFLNQQLSAVGRVTSYIFLIASVAPVFFIIKNLKLNISTFFIFCAIYLSIPVNIYYGRAYLIETTASFFMICSLCFFINYYINGRKVSLVFFGFMATIAILQKSTTELPLLIVITFFILYQKIKLVDENRLIISRLLNKKSLFEYLSIIVPLLAMFFWTKYTDYIKLMNELGKQLTSSYLMSWNFGNIAQRISEPLYLDIIWGRLFNENLGGFFGLSILIYSLFQSKVYRKYKIMIFSLIILGFFPILLFSNLFIVHDYYLISITVFFALALSIAIGSILARTEGGGAAVIVILFLVYINYSSFIKGYYNSVVFEYPANSNKEFSIADFLKRELPEGSSFIAFGNDWSATLAYYSERKSFNVPGWFANYESKAKDPFQLVSPKSLGAVVVCPFVHPKLNHLSDWAVKNGWGVSVFESGCYVAYPYKTVELQNLEIRQNNDCVGNLDVAELRNIDGFNYLYVGGWAVESIENGVVPRKIIIEFIPKNGKSHLYGVPLLRRSDIALKSKADAGFNLILPPFRDAGEYSVRIIREFSNYYDKCQFSKVINVP